MAARRWVPWLAVALATARPGSAGATTPEEWIAQARDARDASRYAEADSLATLARDAITLSTRADSLLLADALHELGESYARRRRYSDSTGVAAAERSLELYDAVGAARSGGAAEAHALLAEYLDAARHSEDARTHMRAAVDIARTAWGPDDVRTGLALERLGLVQSRLGEPDSAIAAFEEALQVARRAPRANDRRPGDLQIGIGLAREAKGDDEGADAALAAGLRSLEAELGPTSNGLAIGCSRAAGSAFRRGETARMIDLMERAVAIQSAIRPSDAPDLLLARAQLATAYGYLGDPARSARTFDDVNPRLRGALGAANHSMLTFELNRASAHVAQGDTAGARTIFEGIRAIYDEDSTRTDRALCGHALVALADMATAQGRFDEARGILERARRESEADAEGDPDLVASVLAMRATVALEDPRPAEADSIDARLAAALERPMSPTEQATAWLARARIAVEQADLPRARRSFAASCRLQREDVAREVRALSDAQALLVARTDAGLDGLVGFAAWSDPEARGAAWTELAAFRGLVRAEIARRRPPPPSASREVLDAHDAWRRAVRQLARYQVNTPRPPDADPDTEESTLAAAADDAERRLVRAFPAAGGDAPDDARTLSRALQALPSGGALAAFTIASPRGEDPHLLVFVAAGASAPIALADLGPLSAVEAAVEAWRATLGNTQPGTRDEAACRASGAKVRTAVWDPIVALAPGATTLWIVPEGPLNGLPWGALPVAGGYLVEQPMRVVVLGAERDLIATDAPATRGALAIGGVDFDGVTTDVAAAARGAAAPPAAGWQDLPALPATGDEARVAAARLRASDPDGETVLLEGRAADEATFKRLASGRRVIHLATHGVALADAYGRGVTGLRGVGGLDDVAAPRIAPPPPPPASPTTAPHPVAPPRALPSPWAARQQLLALAGANRARDAGPDEEDGLLTAAEVNALDLRGTEWVVLSACHSAAGENWTREGVLGLERAFHLAGARWVIAAQWAVEDASTREWMEALYAARVDGARDATDAAAAASRAVLAARRRDGRSTHPFHWAAFTTTRQ